MTSLEKLTGFPAAAREPTRAREAQKARAGGQDTRYLRILGTVVCRTGAEAGGGRAFRGWLREQGRSKKPL
jgi:hypothetical protein